MSKTLILMWKEIRDNLRDRRSLFFALVYGPLLMPSLMLGPIVFNVGKHTQSYDSGREYHVVGETHAPNLLRYLKSKHLDSKPTNEHFQEKISDGEIKIVLEIPDHYGENLLQGKPARIILHYDKRDSESQSLFWQLRGELDGYSRTVAAQRMTIRGFDQTLLKALDIAENDVSQEEFGTAALANIIMFLVVFSSMMGGFYLAVDIIAGERERLTLEPLLSLPISRLQIAMGKFLAVLCFSLLSSILPIISIAIWTLFIGESFFGDADIPGLMTFLKITLISLPISFFMSSFLTAIATYAKSIKEAQTQIGIAMILPMIPFFAVQFLNIKSSEVTQFVPILGQYMLTNKIMMDASYPIAAMLPGAVILLLLSTVFLALSIHKFKQDSILGAS